MRLGGMLRRHMLLYALCVPLYGDFGRCDGTSPVGNENGVENCTDDLTNRCEDE